MVKVILDWERSGSGRGMLNINNILIVPIMETKQAVPSASACMESSFDMRLVAWGMLDE